MKTIRMKITQRKGHREHGETRFPWRRAGRATSRLALLKVANRIFKDDHRIVDQKAHREVSAMSGCRDCNAEHPHHCEGQERKRSATMGIDVSRPRGKEDDQDNEGKGNQESQLYVIDAVRSGTDDRS